MKNQSPFTQLCVWEGVKVGKKKIDEFVAHMENEFKIRVKYAEEVRVGKRIDTFFYIHSDDILKFAVPRLQVGIRWWEDVTASVNGGGLHYTWDVLCKYPNTWQS